MPNHLGSEVRRKGIYFQRKLASVTARYTFPGHDPALTSLQPARENCSVRPLYPALVHEFPAPAKSPTQHLGAWAGMPLRREELLLNSDTSVKLWVLKQRIAPLFSPCYHCVVPLASVYYNVQLLIMMSLYGKSLNTW